MRIAAIVPTWNEQRRIGDAVRHLASVGADEVWVVDGGSADGTAAAAAAAGARVLKAPRGRGTQLRHAARRIDAAVLWFVHADVWVPSDAPAAIRSALTDPRVVGGAFRTRTVDDVHQRFAPLLRLADLRASYTGLPYGDQALFVRRTALEAIGGYPDQPLFEDLEVARRLSRAGRLVVLPGPVRVSGRRFLARPLGSLVAMNLLPLAYRAGVDPAHLARWYGDPR
ncbi:MAG: TIGR04283 family arsenosugar biosynthesis glycosyltransferase [Myxococcota bacterium]